MDDLSMQLKNLVWLKGDWCYPSCSKETDALLRECLNTPTVSTLPESQRESYDLVDEVMKNSERFPVEFPVENIRLKKLKELAPEEDQPRNIASTYPLVHERVLLLMASFIVYMREYGTAIEKSLYNNMTITDLVDRLLTKRSVTFCGASDTYMLLSGEEGHNGWEMVGTLNEKPPLMLANCLSYSEMRLSAMLFVSGRTAFINDGARRNEAQFQQSRQKHGVIIGLIGPRLERKMQMEYEEMMITEQQNRPERGYGEEVSPRTCYEVFRTAYVRDVQSDKTSYRQMWCEFYQVPSYTYEDVSSRIQQPLNKPTYSERFVLRPNSNEIFDNEVYYKRLTIPFECALLDANSRALEDNKMAYLNIVGIGLGVWKVSPHQTDVFVLTFLERLKHLLESCMLNNLAHVNFAFIKPSEDISKIFTETPLIVCENHPNGGIRIENRNREPSSELTGDNLEQLLVTTYAWDGNAHPGNEFWLGSLSSSGDPAAACSTQVAELHNAHINTRYVRANNLRVVGAHGVRSLPEYCRILLGNR